MFEQDLEKSRIAERIAWDLLQHEKNTKFVLDVRDAPIFQEMDVDFLWQLISSEIYFVEVKLDTIMNRTGNIAYEHTTSGNIGCFEKTKAHYIFYYDYEGKIMYVLSASKLRQYVRTAKLELKKMGDNATGYLLSLSDLQRNKVVIKQYKINE